MLQHRLIPVAAAVGLRTGHKSGSIVPVLTEIQLWAYCQSALLFEPNDVSNCRELGTGLLNADSWLHADCFNIRVFIRPLHGLFPLCIAIKSILQNFIIHIIQLKFWIPSFVSFEDMIGAHNLEMLHVITATPTYMTVRLVITRLILQYFIWSFQL